MPPLATVLDAPPQPGIDPVVRAVRDYWDSKAPTFDQGDSFVLRNEVVRAAWMGVFGRILGAPGKHVLDVGSGTGALACLFGEMGHHPSGVDIAPAMVDVARAKAAAHGFAIDFRVGDAHDLPHARETFDVVHARHLLWTLPRPREALQDWIRVLRPGGILLVTESHSDGVNPRWRRVKVRVGRAMASVMVAAHRDVRPGPGRPPDYPTSRLPFARGLGRHGLASFLEEMGLQRVDTMDLLWLRRFQRRHLPWYRRMMSSPLHSYYAGWGVKA